MSATATPTRTATVTTPCKASFMLTGRIVMPLTSCCKATATGTEDGTACRKCGKLIDDFYGGAEWTTSKDLHQFISSTLSLISSTSARRCPCPNDCATEVIFRLGLS